MPASGSELKNYTCVQNAAKPCEIKGRNRTALLALLLALLGSEYLGGCAGLVMGSNPGGSSSPTPPQTSQQAQLSVTPNSASFPNVAAGSVSSQTITITNSGNASATISNVTVTGNGFGTTGLTLPLVVAGGQSSAFNITFTAAGSGSVNGMISIASDAPNSPISIPAAGSIVAATRLLGANPTTLSFGDVMLGTSSALGATLANTGNANVTIAGVTVAGTGFTVSGIAPNTVIGPGQSAVLNSTFTPTAAGNASGTVTVSSDASATVTVSLSGAGVQQSSHSVGLVWEPSTSDVVGYYVYRQTPTSAFAKLNTTPLSLTEFTDSSVQSGQTYTYVITAVDADSNESDYSEPAVVTVPTP